jgi:hypothetical protein
MVYKNFKADPGFILSGRLNGAQGESWTREVAAGFGAEFVVVQQRGSSEVRSRGADASILRQPGTER